MDSAKYKQMMIDIVAKGCSRVGLLTACGMIEGDIQRDDYFVEELALAEIPELFFYDED